MHYLSEMTEEQTLVMYSGHPLGLFPSHRNAPRLIITNGMVHISILFSHFSLLLFSFQVFTELKCYVYYLNLQQHTGESGVRALQYWFQYSLSSLECDDLHWWEEQSSLSDDFYSDWAWGVRAPDQNCPTRLSLEDLKALNRQTDHF